MLLEPSCRMGERGGVRIEAFNHASAFQCEDREGDAERKTFPHGQSVGGVIA
jgi:hypothetical protein